MYLFRHSRAACPITSDGNSKINKVRERQKRERKFNKQPCSKLSKIYNAAKKTIVFGSLAILEHT